MNCTIRTESQHACFGGVQHFLSHDSAELALSMRFSVYLPPQAAFARVPALVYLAGLTCTEETFMTKAGAQQEAARLGIALIAPDTSPRGTRIEGESESWDFGVGAGFYLDATRPPWSTHWRMESYLIDELLPLVSQSFPIDSQSRGIFGHSMGGHGALTLALRHPGHFRSVSAFAPICAPMQCPWGAKAFMGYLGAGRGAWAAHDATELMRKQRKAPYPGGILIDQGLDDKFLETQLHPHLFEEACKEAGQPLTLNRHPGYDHGYYFISTFMKSHLEHHAKALSHQRLN